MRVAWLGLLLLSCASEERQLGDGPVMSARAGARLRPITIVSADGVRIPIGIHDRALDIACAPRLTVDGGLRCLPRTQHIGELRGFFADAGCTRPATTEDPGFPYVAGLAYAYPKAFSCGDPIERIFRIKRESELFTNESGNCVRVEGHWQAYSIGEEVPASAFVAMSPVVTPRFHSETYAGADGSQISFGFAPPRDSAFGAQCTLRLASDGRERCLPDWTATTVLFADGSCTTPALRPVQCAARPVFLREDPGTRRTHAHELGPPLASVFAPKVDGSCVAEAPPEPAFAMGRELAPTEFGLVERIDFGAGRLRVRSIILEHRVFADPDGWIGGRFVDTNTGVRCDLMALGPDEFRCVPKADTSSVVYLDARCTRGVAAVYDERLPTIAYEGGDWLTAAYAVPVAEPTEVPIFERLRGECVEGWRQKVVPLGLAIPLETFAAARITE